MSDAFANPRNESCRGGLADERLASPGRPSPESAEASGLEAATS